MKLLLIEGCLLIRVRMERLLGDIHAIKLIGSVLGYRFCFTTTGSTKSRRSRD
jgi:hypothetical protein